MSVASSTASRDGAAAWNDTDDIKRNAIRRWIFTVGRMQSVQLVQEIELLALLVVRELWVLDVGDELVDLHVGGDDARGLEFGGQESRFLPAGIKISIS